MKADADAYALLHEKTAHAPWYLPSDFDVVAQPGSRLFDPTHLDDPQLPDPSPQLYSYSLPMFRIGTQPVFRQAVPFCQVGPFLHNGRSSR